MKWKTVLDGWKDGKVLKYPKNVKKAFMWKTSKLDKKESNTYKHEFVIYNGLPTIQNYQAYKKYITQSKNKYVVSFMNLTNDTLLVVPIPKRGKNFATIKDFIDNASATHQKKFWNAVASIARKFLKTNDFAYISTHGMGVSYLHVRISTIPRYYGNSKLLKYV